MDQRQKFMYIASFLMLLILVGLVGYLTFIPVPLENKDIIITVLGVLLGGGAAAMPNLFGDRDAETEKLRGRIRNLEDQLEVVVAKYKDVSDRYDTVISMLVNRHFVPDAPLLPPNLPKEVTRFTKQLGD